MAHPVLARRRSNDLEVASDENPILSSHRRRLYDQGSVGGDFHIEERAPEIKVRFVNVLELTALVLAMRIAESRRAYGLFHRGQTCYF